MIGDVQPIGEYPEVAICACGHPIHSKMPWVEVEADGVLWHGNAAGGGHRADVGFYHPPAAPAVDSWLGVIKAIDHLRDTALTEIRGLQARVDELLRENVALTAQRDYARDMLAAGP